MGEKESAGQQQREEPLEGVTEPAELGEPTAGCQQREGKEVREQGQRPSQMTASVHRSKNAPSGP